MSMGRSRPTAPVTRRRGSRLGEVPSTPKAMSHHSPFRSTGPSMPGVSSLMTQVCTAGGRGTREARSSHRKTTPVFGRSACSPTYAAPMLSRTTLRAPSAPTTKSATTSCVWPSGSRTDTETLSASGRRPVTRDPRRSSTGDSSRATSRRTSSVTYWGICWPSSGDTPMSCRPRTPWNRVSSVPSRVVQNDTSWDHDGGSGAAARTRPAMFQRRKCSSVRVFSVLPLGRSRVGCSLGSMTRHGMRRNPSSTARASPTGPPPQIRTGTLWLFSLTMRSSMWWEPPSGRGG